MPDWERPGPVVEDALRGSGTRFRTIFDESDLGISLIDATTGRLLAANRALGNLVGLDPAELEERHVSLFDDLTLVDDREADAAEFADLMEGRRDRSRMAKRFVLPDGRRVWASLISSLLRDADGTPRYVLCMTEDITERRQAEQALRESEARFRAVFEDASVAIALCDVEGNVIEANQALHEMLGLQPGELRTIATFDALTHPDDRAVDTARHVELASGRREHFRQEKRYVRRDGRLVWVDLSVYLVRDAAGQPLYTVGMMKDVTPQKRAEEERARLEVELRHAQKMEAVGRLAGGVAHDFNNLLTAINGYTEFALLALPPASDDVRRDLEEVLRAAGRASELTRQLLAFGRKQMLQPQVLELNAVVRETEKMLRRLIGEHIELEVTLDDACGHVRADPGQLEQVLVNLAINARDAMEHGGALTIATGAASLADDASRLAPGVYARLSVTDTGHGMDEETLSRAFEPFFTTKQHADGTGLGLSTVYGIVSQSGGSISAESRPGEGACFTILLPRVDAPAPAERGAAPASLPRGSESVLVVEDEDVVRRLVCELLERQGYRVLAAATPDEAVARFEDAGGAVDLLLTDLVMPGGGGYDLAARLRARAADLAVLYMSGYSEESHARNRGAAGPLIEKPFETRRLAQLVREALDGRAAPGGNGARPAAELV